MGRRKKETPPEVLFHFLTAMPFWVGPFLAVAVFVGLRFVVPAIIEIRDPQFSSETPQEATDFGLAIFFSGIAKASRLVALWVALAVGGLWIAAETAKLAKPNKRSAKAKPAVRSAALPRASSSAPTCPECGSPMKQRTARKGPNAGSQFWGCSRYPQCRGTRAM